MSCPFCEIDHDRNKVIYETDLVYVTLSNPRLCEGHLLVIPKRHIEKPWEMTVEERKVILDTTLMFQEKIIASLATGCDIRQNYRPFQKQDDLKVDHIHFHLIPRETKDELYNKVETNYGPVFRKLTESEINKIENLFGEKND